jgi:hypothetical protein
MSSNNPLAKHFRHASIYIKLPSGGRYWPDGSLNMPLNGEIPVYPMTTRDEITLRTPDALMNGEGVVAVIQSCCPNIINAWKAPSIDLDAVLIAIRIATYGQSMEVASTCPKCNEESTYDIPLSPILESVNCPKYDDPFKVARLQLTFRPQEYFESTKINVIRFQEDQLIRTITDSEMPDEDRKRIFEEQLDRLVDLNIDLLVASTEKIITEEGEEVKDRNFIKEFYSNIDTATTKKIRQHLEEIRKVAAMPKQHVECTDCSHAYDIALEFDQSNFFGTGS